MVVLPNGDLGVMYETGVDSCYERIEFIHPSREAVQIGRPCDPKP